MRSDIGIIVERSRTRASAVSEELDEDEAEVVCLEHYAEKRRFLHVTTEGESQDSVSILA